MIAERTDRNILLITIDTLRADAISVYGGRASTPYLDELATRGARFTFAHAHAVVTLPSHTSILTGTYPYEHGVRDNNGYRVRKGQPTAATRLKALGFATGAFVGGFPLDQRFGLNAAFDAYDDRIGEVGNTVDFALPERRGDAVVKSALDWIGAQSGKWFSWVHLFDPHAPYRAPAEFASRYPDDPYAAEVAWTDHALGALIDRLSALPRSTLVVVTADHGESLGEHGELTHGIFAYESTLRVPLLIAEIGGTMASSRTPPRGVVITAPVRHIDVLPTILEAAGAGADPKLPGTSLSALIATESGGDRPSYFEAMTANLSRGWAPLRGVLVGTDKYIDVPIPELYALQSDPVEKQNLASAHRDRTDVLLNTLRTFNTAPPALPGEETSAVRDRLRALGYVGGSAAAPRDRYTEDDDPKRLIDVDAMLHRAGDLYQNGRLEEAAGMFQQVIARRPESADAYRYLAFVYWQAGRPGDAIATLETALKNGITHRDVRVKLGVYLAETGNAGARHRAARGAGSGRHRRAQCARHRVRTSRASRRRSANLQSRARDRCQQRPGLAEHRNPATARRRQSGRRNIPPARARDRRHAPGGLHHARGRPLQPRPQAGGDRSVEARGRPRAVRVQRALQPHRHAGRGRTSRRGTTLRRTVHRNGPAGALRERHRARPDR